MQVAIVIPVRYASTRYPGKPLATLKGANGLEKTLVHRTWEAASKVKGVEKVVVATDDHRIVDEVLSFGGESILTSSECLNGTERCAEALQKFENFYDIVVNVQGDAPLSPPEFVESLVRTLKDNSEAQVATPVLRCDGTILSRLKADRKNGRVGGTTVVIGQGNKALYFSKEVIPWCNQKFGPNDLTPIFHHVGIYAYRKEALEWYSRTKPSILEDLEGLEQLRFLGGGIAINCVEVNAKGRVFWELNNPSDIKFIEEEFNALGID